MTTDRAHLDSAYLAGQLACRQLQPITDNPHRKGSPEWHAWVDGWASLRDLAEERARLTAKLTELEKRLWCQEKHREYMVSGLLAMCSDYEERAEFAENAVRQAMEVGLRKCEELRGSIRMLESMFHQQVRAGIAADARIKELEAQRDHWGRAFEDAQEKIEQLQDQLSRAETIESPNVVTDAARELAERGYVRANDPRKRVVGK